MKFGQFDIHTIETGWFRLDGGAMFGVVPKTLWQRAIAPDDRNRIPMTMRSLVLKDRQRVVLIDTGIGTKNPEKFNAIYAVDQSRYRLDPALAGLGIAPGDVTDIILTHLHFDHAGGAVSLSPSGEPEPAFPNATVYVQKKHWDWALKPTLKDQASFIEQDYLPLYDAGKIALLDGPESLIPGLELLVVNGHTIGQQLVKIIDGERSILLAGDLAPMKHHIPEPYIMGYDIQPLVTLEEKQWILGGMTDTNSAVVFVHDREFEAALLTSKNGRLSVLQAGTLDDIVGSMK